MTVIFRELARADLGAVRSLMATSFDELMKPYMVGTQHGWGDFIGVALDHPGQFPAQRLQVAELDAQVVGFADFRVPGDGTGFLSYICVDPAARGRGIARGLLRSCVQLSGDIDTVALDVFEHNGPARAMYDSMGFEARDVQVWWRAPMEKSALGEPVAISDLPFAVAAWERYGFCELYVTRAGQTSKCGRLGSSVLRLFSADDFDDAGLVSSLGREFPQLERTFTVLPEAHVPSANGAEPFNRNIRMRAHDLPRLLGTR